MVELPPGGPVWLIILRESYNIVSTYRLYGIVYDVYLKLRIQFLPVYLVLF